MNSLSQIKMFEPVNKIFKLTDSILNPAFSLEPYIVDYNLYDFYAKIYKGYKYPLAKETINYIESQSVVPILFSDPKSEKDKVIVFSSAIFSFLKQYNKQLTSFVDISNKSKYIRNKMNKEPELLKIDERTLYTFMQTGMLNKAFYTYANAFQYDNKFAKMVSEIYAFLLQKVISSVYPVTANTQDAEILTYLCALFCLQNFFDYDLDKAKALALTIKGIDKANIANNCHFYLSEDNEILDMKYKENNYVNVGSNKVKVFPIDIFVEILSIEFPYVKSGKFESRTLQERWCSMYGPNSLFAVEHFFSFMNMLITSTMRIGYFSDILIEKAAGVYVDNFYKIILTKIS